MRILGKIWGGAKSVFRGLGRFVSSFGSRAGKGAGEVVSAIGDGTQAAF